MTWALANWKLLLIAALLALLGLQTVRVSGLKQDAADQRAKVAESIRQAELTQRNEEQRRSEAVTKEATDAQTRIAALEDDLRAARSAADSLRAAAASAASRARSHPATAATSETTADPIGMLTRVLNELDERAGILAETADRSRIAGDACVRSYEALTIK